MIFKRQHEIRIRVSGILVEKGRVLLVAHRKEGRVYWLLPGGGVEFGERLHESLRREVREELGIGVDVQDIVMTNDSISREAGRHILNVYFLCSYRDGEYRLGSDSRLCDYGFFGKEEIPKMTIVPPMGREILAILDGSLPEKTYHEKEWIQIV